MSLPRVRVPLRDPIPWVDPKQSGTATTTFRQTHPNVSTSQTIETGRVHRGTGRLFSGAVSTTRHPPTAPYILTTHDVLGWTSYQSHPGPRRRRYRVPVQSLRLRVRGGTWTTSSWTDGRSGSHWHTYDLKLFTVRTVALRKGKRFVMFHWRRSREGLTGDWEGPSSLVRRRIEIRNWPGPTRLFLL